MVITVCFWSCLLNLKGVREEDNILSSYYVCSFFFILLVCMWINLCLYIILYVWVFFSLSLKETPSQYLFQYFIIVYVNKSIFLSIYYSIRLFFSLSPLKKLPVNNFSSLFGRHCSSSSFQRHYDCCVFGDPGMNAFRTLCFELHYVVFRSICKGLRIRFRDCCRIGPNDDDDDDDDDNWVSHNVIIFHWGL